jgi:hypothetical protein
MRHGDEIHSCAELMAYIQEVGFLPLLDSGIAGYSAEAVVDDDNRYVLLPDGGWDWPLWKWKGPIVQSGICVYGKFFAGKAGFVSREWWPDFCNYRRNRCPAPAEGSIEEAIVLTLQEHGSQITRELRAACGFTGPKMRSRFDAYITRLQMACRIVTEDFVYPLDKHNNEYGWGWALLTTPEQLLGRDGFECQHSAEESRHRLLTHFHTILPNASDRQIEKLVG